MASSQTDAILITRVRAGDADAWQEVISRFEGRLLAFINSRLGRRGASEDVVQETFIGFLTSLPNYDESRSLEGYLFSIAAHKLTDHLRREGRRPALPLTGGATTDGQWEPAANMRKASSILRSDERQGLEAKALAAAMREQFVRWQERGDWIKLQCVELLFVRGMPNKDVAELLNLSEQQVANFKFDFLARLRTIVRRQGLSRDVFPEVYEGES